LPYYVRLMHEEDIAQVAEIDHEAFPKQWPPANYRRELHGWLAHYVVACDDSDTDGESAPLDREYILGFASFWIMADEAHITNIAVRKTHRRRGIGELLLISMIGLATELHTRNFTLEVRASNTAAQNLYSKYDFNQVGLRRGYYTDNKEDAVLMSIEYITSPSFQSRLTQLKKAHSHKYGIALYQVAH